MNARYRGYRAPFGVKLCFEIVVVKHTKTREIQELLIWSLSIALDDFDYHYFYPNTSRLQKRTKSLTGKRNTSILKKHQYHRIRWLKFIVHMSNGFEVDRDCGNHSQITELTTSVISGKYRKWTWCYSPA